jgi:LysR family nitrogen assimilation transcriptional regulator
VATSGPVQGDAGGDRIKENHGTREGAINLRQLTYFVRTVDAGNITRAAEQLNVAQPALGLQIRQLEEELGVALLIRHSRGVTATQAGRVLYDRAQDILRGIEEARREVLSFGGAERESISIGLTPGLVTLLGGDILVDARTELPKVHLSLIEEMSHVLIDALERREIDFALSYGAPERSGLLRTPLIEEEMLFLTCREHAKSDEEPVSLSEVIRRPLALTGERDPVRQMLAAAAEGLGLPLNVAFEASSVAVIKDVIARGAACGVMAYGSAAQELRQGTLVGRRIRDGAIKRTLHLVRLAQRAPFRQEHEILAFVARAVTRLVQAVGPLARPLPDLERLPEALAAG